MKWLKSFKIKPVTKKKRWLTKDQKSVDPMKNRAPFHADYDYSYGAPYEGSSYDEYSKGEGKGKIRMDPEKGVGLGLG